METFVDLNPFSSGSTCSVSKKRRVEENNEWRAGGGSIELQNCRTPTGTSNLLFAACLSSVCCCPDDPTELSPLVFIVPESRLRWRGDGIRSHRNWALMSPAFIGIEFPAATLVKHVHISDGSDIRYQVWDCRLHPWLIPAPAQYWHSPTPSHVKRNFYSKTPLNFCCLSR